MQASQPAAFRQARCPLDKTGKMPVLPAGHCRYASANVNITAFRPPHAHAKNSSDGLRRQAAAGLPVYRPALATVAISIAPSAFQCAPPTSAEFCALDSRLRHCSPRDVADSNRDCDLGARATRRIVELDSPSNVDRRRRDVSFDGLRLLVVALGHAHGAVLLAIS